MKRFATLIVLLSVLVLVSGCSILRGVIHKAQSFAADQTSNPVVNLQSAEPTDEATPALTDEPTASPAAETAEAQPTATVNPNVYTSTAMGISFTMPESWAGKCRVEEGDGYLNVYFTPEKSFDETMGDGHIFTIMVKESADDGEFFDNERELEINCVKYLCGTSTDVSYSEGQPEYDTFTEMMKDVPTVFDSIRAADASD